jgi:hypothetical protein
LKKLKTSIDESLNNFLNILLKSQYKRFKSLDFEDELKCFYYLKCIFKVRNEDIDINNEYYYDDIMSEIDNDMSVIGNDLPNKLAFENLSSDE